MPATAFPLTIEHVALANVGPLDRTSAVAAAAAEESLPVSHCPRTCLGLVVGATLITSATATAFPSSSSPLHGISEPIFLLENARLLPVQCVLLRMCQKTNELESDSQIRQRGS